MPRAIGKAPSQPLVTIIEFGDYQCPVCRDSAPHLEAVIRKYPSDVTFIYRHYPLPNHQYAYPAARVAECAAEQNKFWEVHDLLYANDNWLGDAFRNFALTAGVADSDQFMACISQTSPVEAIERDLAAVRELGSRGTPTFLINGLMFSEYRDSVTLFGAIDEILARSR